MMRKTDRALGQQGLQWENGRVPLLTKKRYPGVCESHGNRETAMRIIRLCSFVLGVLSSITPRYYQPVSQKLSLLY